MSVARPLPDVPGLDVRHRWVDLPGVRVHVAEAGPPDGAPVLLQHGWPQHWLAWRRVAPALAADGHRLLMPDLRGLGWSEAPPGDYAKETWADDVLALLDALGIERLHGYLGHDWGGFVGYLVALRAPERIARLATTAIMHPFGRRGLRARLDALRAAHAFVLAAPLLGEAVLRDPSASFLRGAIRLGTRVERALGPEETASYAAALREPARARASQAIYRTFVLREAAAIETGRYRGSRLEMPVLYVHPCGDVVITERAIAGLEDHAADLRVEKVPGAGHFLPEEDPEALLAHVRPFFAP